MGIGLGRFAVESDWRNETLRTNLWLIPAIESVAAILLFALTLSVDRAAFHHEISLPSWVISGSPDAARQILSSLAAAIITVVGVVFSIMIVTLTLASTQFGPRMLRTFIRDRGTQLTLGTFVATFFYAMLALISNRQTERSRQRPLARRAAGPARSRRPHRRRPRQRVPAVRPARDVDADRRRIRRRDPAALPPRPLTSPGLTGSVTACARSRSSGIRTPITVTATVTSASSPRRSATSGWYSARSRRSGRRPTACPRC
jgi:predicted membrane protein DUF2254